MLTKLNTMIKLLFLITLLTPLSSLAETVIEEDILTTADELLEIILDHNVEAPSDRQIYDKESYNQFFRDLYGAPADPTEKFGKDFFEKLKALYCDYETFLYYILYHNETKPPRKKIYDEYSFLKWRHELPKDIIPPYPRQFYKKEWLTWEDFLNPYNYYFDLPTFLITLRNYNKNAPPDERIYNDETYNKFRHHLSKRAPPNPFKFYKIERLTWDELLNGSCIGLFQNPVKISSNAPSRNKSQ